MNEFPAFRPRRKITGMSAVLLPMSSDGCTDWPAFRRLISRTFSTGLTPAVNMDTGYANLIDEDTRSRVLIETRDVASGRPFIAGAFVSDVSGDPFDHDAYAAAVDAVAAVGGTPILFQSHGLTALGGDELIHAYERIGRETDGFYGFELGTMFAPFGRIYSLEDYERLMRIPECLGAKHSSLSRQAEWERLALRDRVRPEFLVLTGNDLAIDMMAYGSDYLLGLSAFHPEAFARRDALWATGDPSFWELNDLLQYLGFFAFRPPVPAYKHSCAMTLKLRGLLDCDDTHKMSPTRPGADRAVLADIVSRLDELV